MAELFHTPSVRITLPVIVIVLFSAIANTQDREVMLSISHPRPLAEVARQLEEKFGMAISYEDVALVYSSDYARPLDTDWGRKTDEEGDHRFRANNRIDVAGVH